jgi:hypothetical protein
MEKTTVSLGGQAYTVVELKRKANSVWRQKLQAEFADIAQLIGDLSNIKIKDGEALKNVMVTVTSRVSSSLDLALELVIAYSPALENDRDRIIEEAYDSEILQAFVAILGLAYPFGSVLSTISGLAGLGRQAQSIGANSASPSTESTTAS